MKWSANTCRPALDAPDSATQAKKGATVGRDGVLRPPAGALRALQLGSMAVTKSTASGPPAQRHSR